jgi:hypothetical protein
MDMQMPGNLSLEQQFKLKLYQEQVKSLTQEHLLKDLLKNA